MIQEKMKASQSRHKSDHDKRRKDIEFQAGDHVFLRVNPITGVGRALKCRKLTPRFVGPFEIIEKVGMLKAKSFIKVLKITNIFTFIYIVIY